MVGMGKLGLPVAIAIEKFGEHEVMGYDPAHQWINEILESGEYPHQEVMLNGFLAEGTRVRCAPSIYDLTAWEPDVVFVAVQTPHSPEYEGVTELPDERIDFDYSYLTRACDDLFRTLKKPTVVGIISTVLPGTIEREVRPLMNRNVRLVYTPQFIAMGTVIPDFLSPEFVLLGVDQESAADDMETLFDSVLPYTRSFVRTDIATAEGIKVFYNTFITAKTVLANIYGELAEKLGMNVDDIFEAISLSTKRLLSTRYLKAGVGDGGGCHPRDNIALSWLAQETDLSFDIFEALMVARQEHMRWIADVAITECIRNDQHIVMFGEAFKPGTNITTGSPARLLETLLTDAGFPPIRVHDPYVEEPSVNPLPPIAAVYVIATDHGDWPDVPRGSTVIDPFGSYPDVSGVKVMRLGRKSS